MLLSPDQAAARVRRWLKEFVVGLDLCPFARGPLEAGRVRIAISDATDAENALSDLWLESDKLLAADPAELETTLIVYPNGFDAFDVFYDVVLYSEEVLERAGHADDLQVVGFHPRLVFEGEPDHDPAHYANRSPFPLLHVLRRSSVARAVAAHPDAVGISHRNAAMLRKMPPGVLEAMRLGEDVSNG